MARANSFEGSSDETNVSVANSVGGGSAFDDVNRGTGATVVYDDAQAALGTFSCRTSTSGTSATAYVAWTLASVTSDYCRMYVRLTGLPSAAAQPILRYMSGANQAFRVNIKSGGAIEVRDAGQNVVGTTTSTVSTSVGFRIEVRPVLSTTVGAIELRYYASQNSTGSPTETLNLTGLTLTASASEIRFGVGAGLANAVNVWFDNVATEGTTWFGPALVNGTGLARAATFGTTAAGTRTVLGTAARATTFATSASGLRTVFGTGARATTFGLAAAGVRTVLGTAARPTTFGTSASGLRTVAGTASRATVFSALAIGDITVFDSTPGVLTASTPTAALTATGTRSSLNATTPATAALAATTSP